MSTRRKLEIDPTSLQSDWTGITVYNRGFSIKLSYDKTKMTLPRAAGRAKKDLDYMVEKMVGKALEESGE